MSDKNNLAKYACLFEDIRAADIMTTTVTALPSDKKISHAKEMMNIKRISGVPVVDESRHLIGIVTVEDIIHALEFNRINEPIRNLMTRSVVTMRLDERLVDIVSKFEEFHFGRFPVVDGDNVLRGIISREDILNGLLEKFNLIYVHDQKRISTLNSEFSFITGKRLTVDHAEFHYNIDTNDLNSAGAGAVLLKKFLNDKQYPAEIIRRIGVAVYEAETNVIIHSHGNGDIFCFLHDDLVMVRVVDNGMGIEDMDMAMKEGYSTAPDYIREQGFGAGMGIPNIKRFVDKLVILSEKNVGTQVEMILYLPEQAAGPV
ncbi:MAG: CBS domain-containing protein [Spirochaetales bacterium]|nr:MAG: CBS domain-containing protein [Spirochaetales bacterium]